MRTHITITVVLPDEAEGEVTEIQLQALEAAAKEILDTDQLFAGVQE